jgi:hypothetical protein
MNTDEIQTVPDDQLRQQVGTVLMPVISDDQQIGVFVTALNTSEVAVYFPAPVSGMILTSAEARSMGKSLLEKADAAEAFAAQHGNPVKTTRKRHKKEKP